MVSWVPWQIREHPRGFYLQGGEKLGRQASENNEGQLHFLGINSQMSASSGKSCSSGTVGGDLVGTSLSYGFHLLQQRERERQGSGGHMWGSGRSRSPNAGLSVSPKKRRRHILTSVPAWGQTQAECVCLGELRKPASLC